MADQRQVIGHCGQCGTAIPANHPYAWCSECGTSLPATVKAELARLNPPAEAGAPSRSEGVPLVVEGSPVQCPICRHDRYRVRRSIIESRTAAVLDVEWASPPAETYACLRCGHVMWFMR